MQLIATTNPRSILKTAGWVLPLAIIFPIIIHVIPPYNGIPIGAYLLPMFYIPFVALVWYRLPVALIVAALAPILNFTLTGNPQWGFMAILTTELILFTVLANMMLKGKLKWIAAPLSYIGAKVISSVLLLAIPFLDTAPFLFFTASLTNAAPGILILLVINIVAVKYNPPINSGR
jgi:glucose-6-phosphate-specific signal transduction histidine kinase